MPTESPSAAETELCRLMAPRIRLYGLRHLRDHHAADDLVQQVLILTIEALRAGRVRESENLPSFVLGACRMTVLDIRRNAQRRRSLLLQHGPAMLAPAEAALPNLDTRQLSRCLQQLKERERTAIVLSFYEEQSGPDVARLLDISEANLRVIRHRAIHQLRHCMGAAA